jgi:transposase
MAPLTTLVKCQIIALRQCGKSWNDIAKQLQLNKSTARAVFAKYNARGTVENGKSPGRPSKFSATSERRLSRLATANRRATLAQLTDAFNDGLPTNHQVCSRSVRRALHRRGIHNRIAAKKLCLKAHTRQYRMRWCRDHTGVDWSTVVFTDEVRIGLRNDGRIRIWRRNGDRFQPGCTTASSSSRHSLMFWGFLTKDGVGLLLPCTNKMNAAEYIRIMETAAISSLPDYGMVYMDDNAPIHRAAVVRQWKMDFGIQGLDWPPYSPDLNPIENVWAYLKHSINKQSDRPHSLAELRNRLTVAWNCVPKELVVRLYASMPGRLRQCLRVKGYPIRY